MTVSEDDPLIKILDIVFKLLSVQYILSSVLSKSSAVGRRIRWICAIGNNLALVFDSSRDNVYIWRLSAKSNIF